MRKQEIRVGLIGVGVVGQGVLQVLRDNAQTIEERLGAPITVSKMVARDPNKSRDAMVPPSVLTFDADDVVNDPDIDIVVEVIGGIEPALSIIKGAMEQGKHVVTANKALIAEHGHTLFELAEQKKTDLYFEAAVGGGIPILRVIREALASDQISSLSGIVNGTSNYILSRMRDSGLDFDVALKEAQELGYAEADPTLDVNGGDAKHKLTILATLAFGAEISTADIPTQGIDEVNAVDMKFADRFGYAIKPLAVARKLDNGKLDLRVHPALLKKTRPLVSIGGALNAVFLEGAMLGPCLLSGLGAGALPTAMSVVSDIVDVARNLQAGAHARVPGRAILNKNLTKQPFQDISELVTRYYLRFPVKDEPGVLAQVATLLGEHDISIEQMVQDQPQDESGNASIVMLTHEAREGNVQNALKAIEGLSGVIETPRALRIDD